MTRPTKRRPATVWIDWTRWVAELFEAIPDDWTPPTKAKLVHSDGRLSWSARYVLPDGAVTTARIRLRRDRHAGWIEDEPSLEKG